LANAPRKVPLVDDNADAVAVVAAWLKRAGCGRISCSSIWACRAWTASRWREAGFDQYLLKPIDLEFLRSLLG